MCVALYPEYLIELIFWGWWIDICGHLCVTSLLFCICSPNPWVLFSGVGVSCWMSLSAYWRPGVFGGQALSARCIRWPGFVPISFLSLCHRRRVAGLSMLYKVNSNSNHRLFNKLPSASHRVWHTRAAAAAHPLRFVVLRCRTSKFARYFLLAQVWMSNDLPYTVFDTETLHGFKGAVNRWLLPWIMFSSVFRGAGAYGVVNTFINNFVLPTWACAAGFNNNIDLTRRQKNMWM